MTANIIHDLPAEEYHRSEGLSASTVKTMAMKTPAEARYAFDNPKDGDHFLLGTLTHAMILEPDKIETAYMVVQKFPRRSAAEKERWAEYEAEAKAQGKILVREGETGEMDLARAMRDAVHASPDARELLKVGHPEVSLYAEDPDTGMMLKSREDWMPDSNLVVDLKTAKNPGRGFANDAYKLGYHVGAYHYCRVRQLVNRASLAGGGDGPSYRPEYRWIVVGSAAPHLVSVYEPDEDMKRIGEAHWRRGRDRLIECRASGQWPGLPEGVTAIGPPSWAMRDLEDEPVRRELTLDELMGDA